MAAGLSTASPPVLTPGSNHVNYEVFSRTVESATYQKQQLIPRFKDVGRPYSKLTINKWARVSSTALAAGNHGTGLTYQDPVATPPTLDPAGIYVALAFSQNEAAENPYDLDSELSDEATRALAEGNDTNAALQFPALTQFRGNATDDVTSALLRNAQALLTRNSNGMIAPGAGMEIYLVLDASQYPAVMSIEEYANAEARGDGENPYVKGVWSKGGGHNLLFSTVLSTDVDGTHGALWVKEALGVGWNVRSMVKKQSLELQERCILFNHLGTTVIHDLRAVAIRTGNTIAA
ncbi:MAG: hypothetical protein ACT4PE_05520 [Candidatus Eiseniibacteriota bacterium]